MSEEIDEATMETYLKANNNWLASRGFAPLDMETYKKIRKVIVESMKGELEGYKRLGSVGVTFTDKQREAIQENIKQKEQER